MLITAGQKEGANDLKMFMKALDLLFKKIYDKSNDFRGRVAEIVGLKQNTYNDDSFDE